MGKRIAEATWGATTVHRDVTTIHGIDMTEEAVDGKKYRLRKYFLSGDNVGHYQFGARDLLEYIAFKIGFGGTERGDDDQFITLLLRSNWTSRGVPHHTVAQKLMDRYSQPRETMQNLFPAVSFPAIYPWLDQRSSAAAQRAMVSVSSSCEVVRCATD